MDPGRPRRPCPPPDLVKRSHKKNFMFLSPLLPGLRISQMSCAKFGKSCYSNCCCTCPADTKTAHRLTHLFSKLPPTPRYGHCLSPGVDPIYGSHMLPFENLKLSVLVCWCMKVVLCRESAKWNLWFLRFIHFIQLPDFFALVSIFLCCGS